jgi:hypothetical protein
MGEAGLSNRMNKKERFEHLVRVISSQRFLQKQGLGNEVPFFICPIDAAQGSEIFDDVQLLSKNLRVLGCQPLHVDLYDLSLAILEERGILGDVLNVEQEYTKSEIKELLQGVLDPATHLIPRIGNVIANQAHDVIFITGVGEVYPYIRSHSVLNNLQSTAKDRPTVMFFPGNYTHALATGASLELFGLLHDDKYYRAFNIMNYEV